MTHKQFYNSTAWKYLSRYIKIKYSQSGIVKCFTCGRFMPVADKKTHAGHLIKFTDSKSVCMDEENIGVQCYYCNRMQGGRQDLMKEKLIQIHGEEKINTLYIKRHNITNLDKFTMDLFAGIYKKKFNDLLKELNIKNPWN